MDVGICIREESRSNCPRSLHKQGEDYHHNPSYRCHGKDQKQFDIDLDDKDGRETKNSVQPNQKGANQSINQSSAESVFIDGKKSKKTGAFTRMKSMFKKDSKKKDDESNTEVFEEVYADGDGRNRST